MERKSIVLAAASPTSSLRPQLRVAGACQSGLLARLPRSGLATTRSLRSTKTSTQVSYLKYNTSLLESFASHSIVSY